MTFPAKVNVSKDESFQPSISHLKVVISFFAFIYMEISPVGHDYAGQSGSLLRKNVLNS